MKKFAKFYFVYNSVNFRIIRIFLFLIFLTPVIFGIFTHLYPNLFIIPFSLYLIFEIYFLKKVSKLMPKTDVLQNTGDIFDSFSLDALSFFESQENSKNLIKELLNHPQIQFIVYKCDANLSDIQFLEIDKTLVATNAFNIAKSLNAKHVTTMDLFVSYLLLTEPETQFLFNKKLKEKDIENILLWASNTYPHEELSKNMHVSFASEGIAEDWVYGWTIETKKYMIDLTKEFLTDGNQPIGRQNEYKQMVEALHKGSSVILVGDSGSGKESSVKELAMQSFYGTLKGNLYHQKVFRLMVDAFMAGANNQGELEQRLTDMMAEVSHSGNVIIYIPDFQNILGSESFHLDLSGAIIPYLGKGNVRIIAAVSPSAFKQFIEPMHSLLDSFTVINFPSPSKEEVLDMLFAKALDIELANKVSLSYRAILIAANYGGNYAKEKVMPGSAVLLLEDSANAVALSNRDIVEESDILLQIKKVVHVNVGEPKVEEKTLLLNLEQELHKRIIAQDEAVKAVSEAIRRLRAGLTTSQKPISFLFLGPTGVGKTATAKALADVYFGEKTRLIRLDMSEYTGEDGVKKLLGSPPGQGDEKGYLTESIYDNPYSLIILDEFEKADSKILDLFLQVFEEGRLTDSKGKTVSFVNSIIIATSNAASEFIRENVAKNTAIDKKFKVNLMEFLQTKAILKPELLNRFDDIIVFKPLGAAEVIQIIKLLLIEFSKTLSEKDIKISFDEGVINKIANEGFDRDFGARPLRRFIQDNIEDLIARKMLTDEIKRGDRIAVVLDSLNTITLLNN